MAGPGRGGRRRYVLVLLVLTSVTLITLDQREGGLGSGRRARTLRAPRRVAGLRRRVERAQPGLRLVRRRGARRLAEARERAPEARARGGAHRRGAREVGAQAEPAAHASSTARAVPRRHPVRSSAASSSRRPATSTRRSRSTTAPSAGSRTACRSSRPTVSSVASCRCGRADATCSCSTIPTSRSVCAWSTMRATGVADGSGRASRRSSVTLGGPLAPTKRPRKGEIAETSGLQGTHVPAGHPRRHGRHGAASPTTASRSTCASFRSSTSPISST